jgi:hypothetical protein
MFGIDNHGFVHFEPYVMAIVALNPTERRWRITVRCWKRFEKSEPVAEARSKARGLCRGFKMIGDAREIVGNVMTTEHPAVASRGPYDVLKEPLLRHKLDIQLAADVEELLVSVRIGVAQVITVENNALFWLKLVP